MKTTDSKLLAETLELTLERDQDFPVAFYKLLFERYPTTQPLFVRNTLGAQRKMLGQALMAVVDHFEDPAWLAENLGPMGRDHLAYGVTPQMYDWVGECMIDAMAETCGESWRPEHQAAWESAYQEIVRYMRAGERPSGG